MDFKTIPNAPVTLKNLCFPSRFADESGAMTRGDLTIADGRICDPLPGVAELDMAGAMAFSTFVDMHTHLDKGHIWPRATNPDGSFAGALASVAADRRAHWAAGDVRRRMDFALRCAWAHGTSAIRTHIDSSPPQDAISFPVFREIRQDWSGRIALQAACLVGLGEVDDTGPFARTADIVAETDGVLGCATYPSPDAKQRLQTFFRIAESRGLAVDFHVDETGDASSGFLRMIAETVLERGFQAPVTVGHCCSLAIQHESEALRTLDLVARAGLNVVSLPMCNLYLQDRSDGRTPRWRGITLVHEMAERGINVSFASDNTRDPFFAYGDLDMIEVMREATRIGHLDHSSHGWIRSFTINPAKACGFDLPSLARGDRADLVICRARNWTELFARPQADRIVLRGGQQIDRMLPDYGELDDLATG